MQTPAFVSTSHDPLLVAASLVVAVFASYVALDLTRRVQAATGMLRLAWWAGGSVVLGTGIWSMHFVGMLGFEAGMPLGYRWWPTAASWLAAVSAASVALGAATRQGLTPPVLVGGSVTMALAVCAMHYLGMGALDMAPGLQWHWPLVLVSGAIAWGASAVALFIFFALRARQGLQRVGLQMLAAVVMGLAIGGMHYTGMAAVRLPQGAVCLSSGDLGGQWLAVLVTLTTLLVLGGALLLSINDALAHARELALSDSLRQANLSLREANAQLQRHAFEDPLSGLPNRALFHDRLQHAIHRLGRRDRMAGLHEDRLAVLFLDLDGFKPINDTLGHQAGDEVLREVGRRLHSAARSSDTLARLGGDEFAVLIESRDAAHEAMPLARRMIEVLHRPFTVAAQRVSLSCSVGVALYPDHDDAGHRLLACADAAMYAAKRAGGSTCVVYHPGMEGDAGEQLALQQELRDAIDHGELRLYYQPKVCSTDGRVHGWEALVRWQHPQRGLLSPAVFIPLAERFGLIGSLGNWVVEAACAQLARWREAGLHCRIAINVSPQQLRQADLAVRIEDALVRHALPPEHLVCEITESAVMENTEQERGMLERIVALGVRLSIDDFGTGYSSLAHLRKIPARQLKIDRSFVTDLATSAEAHAVLDAIVRLAHALKMEVVAEGVETQEQMTVLTGLGCDILQGYFIARPMPAGQVPAWVAGRAPAPAGPATMPR